MRTKKIGDQSPLRVSAVSAKKIAILPLLIASFKSKGRSMIAKMEKRKQDDGSFQFLFKQIEDALFNALRGFSVAPICHIRRPTMELVDILKCISVMGKHLYYYCTKGCERKKICNTLYYADWP